VPCQDRPARLRDGELRRHRTLAQKIWADNRSTPKAQLPTGEKLNGSDELKRLLIQRKEVFLRNMTGQMLSYALGRQLQPADAATVEDVVSDMQQNGNRFFLFWSPTLL